MTKAHLGHNAITFLTLSVLRSISGGCPEMLVGVNATVCAYSGILGHPGGQAASGQGRTWRQTFILLLHLCSSLICPNLDTNLSLVWLIHWGLPLSATLREFTWVSLPLNLSHYWIGGRKRLGKLRSYMHGDTWQGPCEVPHKEPLPCKVNLCPFSSHALHSSNNWVSCGGQTKLYHEMA